MTMVVTWSLNPGKIDKASAKVSTVQQTTIIDHFY